MRRPKREIKDLKEIQKVIEECKVCRIGLQSQGEIYIVPMNFGCEYEDGKPVFYFHSAKVGRKMESLREEPEICVELDCRHGLMEADKPCDYSYYFASFIGNGKVKVLQTPEEKLHGLKAIMYHQTGKYFDNFDEKWINAVEVMQVKLNEYTCKHHDGTN